MYGLFPVKAGVSATTISSISPGAGRGKRGLFGMAAGAAALAGCGGGGDGGGGGGGGTSNRPPEVSDNPLADLAVDTGADIVPINLGAAYFTDADGDDSALTFMTEGELPTGLTLSGDGVITGRLADPGEHEITIIVTDADGNPFRHTFTITSETPVSGQRRPTVDVDSLSGDRVETVGEAIGGIDVAGGFGDPEDDDDLTFEVEFSRDGHGLTFNPSDNTITGTLTGSGDVTAIITVRNGADGDDPSVEHRIVIEANDRPAASDNPLREVFNVTGGQAIDPIDLSNHFTDPDGDDADLVFDVSFSTTDGHNLTFDSTTNRITGQLDAGEIVSVTVTVTVTDVHGARTPPISFTITTAAEGQNVPPTASGEPLLDVVLRTGVGISLDVSGAFRDPDGEDGDLTFGATGLDGTGLSIDTSSGVISGSFTGSNNVDAVTVTAMDGRGGSVSRTFGITVAEAGPLRGSGGRELFIGGPEDDTIIGGAGDDAASYRGALEGYSLVTGLSADGGVQVIVEDTAPTTAGNDGTDTLTEIEEIRFSDVTIQVSGLVRVNGMEAENEVGVEEGGSLDPIDLNTWFTAGVGGDLMFVVMFDPLDGGGLTFDGENTISGSPTGAVTVTVIATETGVTGVVSARHTFVVGGRILAPSGNPLGDLTVDTGADIVPIDLRAGYFLPPNESALTYSASGLPTGLVISPEGVIMGRIADAGVSTVRITATDSDMNEFTHTFTITAEAPVDGQRRPTFVVEDLAGGQVVTIGDEIGGIDVTGGFGDPEGDDNLTYTVAFSRTDSGLTFNSTDNTITGTLAGTGNVVAIVTVTNGTGGRAVEHRIVIEANNPPGASAGEHPNIINVTAGQPIDQIDLAGRFTDPDGDELEFAVTFSPVDGHGLMFDSTTNRITGQLEVGGVASVGLTVTVTDGRGGSFESRFTITTAVEGENLPPIESGEPLRDIVLNSGVDVSVDVSGAFIDPEEGDLTYSAAVGGTALADAGIGLSIDADSGVISGTFSGSANVDDVTVTATDGNGGSAARTFDITVVAAGETLMGGDAPELFVGGTGDDEIIGGGGDDAAAYGGDSADYSLETKLSVAGGVRVTVEDTNANGGDDGTDTLTGIEEIRFSDRTIQDSELVRVNGMEASTGIEVTGGGSLDPIDLDTWFEAGNVDGDLTFEVVFGPRGGGGLTFDGDNTITGSPEGSVTVTVTARETGVGNVSARHDFTVWTDANEPPAVSSLHNVVARTGATNVSFDVSGAFDDPEGDGLTFSGSGLTGTGLTLDTSTGVISGTALTGTGDTEVTVTADDGNGGTVEAAFTLRRVAAGEEMVGTVGNDLVFATSAVDEIDGRGGEDIVVFDGNRDDYEEFVGRFLNGKGGEVARVLDVEETGAPANADELRGIEILRFDSGDLPFDREFADARKTEGAAGDDVLRGGSGDDSIRGHAGHDALHGEEGTDRLEGGRGNDTLRGGGDMDTAVYAKDIDEYTFGSEVSVDGGSTVTWHIVTDKDGGSSGEGRDRLLGVEFLEFDGTRVALGDLPLDDVFGSGGVDAALNGGDGSQEIFGFAGGDTLRGGGGADFLEGGEGDDMLRGDEGDDMIYGDAGMDTAVYAGARAEFDVSFHSASSGASSFRATVRDMVTDTGADEGTDTLTGITAIAFSDQTLTLVETGTSGADILFGNGIQFRNGTRLENGVVEVSEIPEVIDGMGGDDLIFGFEGSDVITGGAGDDTIHGGDGRDVAVYIGALGDYTITRELRIEDGNVVVWHVVEHDNSGTDGRDELTGVETLRFSGVNVAVSELEIGVIEGSGLGDEVGRPIRLPTEQSYLGSGRPKDVNALVAYRHTKGEIGYQLDPLGNYLVPRDVVLYGFDNNSDTLHGGRGNDRIHGFGGNDTIRGGDGNDWIIAGDGNDRIILRDGSDSVITIDDGSEKEITFLLKVGNDTIRGGAGQDTVEFRGDRNDYSVRKDFRMDALGNKVDWYTFTRTVFDATFKTEITGVELFKFGNAQATPLSSLTIDSTATTALSAAEGANHPSLQYRVIDETIRGGAGDDTLWGGGGSDTLEGGEGDDTLVGGFGNDTLEGGAGNDTLEGDVGNDTFPGTDTAVFRGNRDGYQIVVGEGGVSFVRDIDPNADGDEGFDELRGIEALRFKDETITLVSTATGDGDILLGGNSNDLINGGGGDDVMFGGGGNDVLSQSAGADLMDGGGPGDIDRAEYTGSRADYEITERRGVEYGLNGNGERVFVTLFEVSETSSGDIDHVVNVENFRFSEGFLSASSVNLDPETVIGSSGDDNITSSDRANTLSGGSGNDTLSSGSGNDTLRGGSGDDTLDGGADTDKAQFVGHWIDPGTSEHRFEILHDGTDFIVRDIAGVLGNEALAVSREGATDTRLRTMSITNTRTVTDRVDVLVDAGGQGQDTLKNIEVVEFLDPATGMVDREFRNAAVGSETANNDLIVGPTSGGATFTGGGGDDVIVGRSPSGDTAVFTGMGYEYTITLEHRFLPIPPGHFTGSPPGSIEVHVVEHMNGGSDGRDELIGIEMLKFGSSAAVAVGDFELDGVEGGGTLTGGNGDDAIKGRSTHDTLNGGAGDDTLEGGGGDDTLDGGGDRDTAVFSGNSGGYSVSANSPGGNLTVEDVDDVSAGNGVDDGTDTLTNVEVLRFAEREIAVVSAATAVGEILLGTASADSSIDGLAGDDLLFGLGGDDSLTGGEGNDVIDGGVGTGDKAVYSGGRDGYRVGEVRRVEDATILSRIIRVEDIDTADGDDGVDMLRDVEILEFNGVETSLSDLSPEITIIGSSKGDELIGGVGGVLDGGGGFDTAVYIGSRNDFTVTREFLFVGDADVPTLTFTVEDGNGAVDRLIDIERLRFLDGGNTVNVPVFRLDSVISGDDGDNVLGEFVLVADTAVEGLGDEVAEVYQPVIERYNTQPAFDRVGLVDIQRELDLGTDDTIHGHGGNDSIRGGAGDDTLRGGEGRDRLFGGPGDDTLDGGEGRDRIDGGEGVDTVVYAGTIHDYRFALNPDDFGSIVVIDSRVGGNFDEAGALDDSGAGFETDLEKARALEEGRALDEGRDELVDVEIIRFGDGREIRTSDIEFGSVTPPRGTTFEFLSADADGIGYTYGLMYDSTTRTHERVIEVKTETVNGEERVVRENNKHVLTNFNPREGDRIALADIPELRGLTADLVLVGNGVPLTRLRTPNSDFKLNVVGDFVKDKFVAGNRIGDFVVLDESPDREKTAFDILEYIDHVDPNAESSRIHVRPSAESTMVGHDGLDVFQFLTAEDSAGSGRTTIKNFNPLDGDLISLADIGDLRGLAATLHLVTDVGPVTRLTTPNSTFELNIAGDFVSGSSVGIVAGASPGTTMNSIIMDGAITPSTILSRVSHDPDRGIDLGLDIFDHINYIGGGRFPVGGVGADVIEGGAGNDTLTGGPGDDSLDGGGGSDTAFYFGGVRNFQFAPDAVNPDHLTVTDANARNYPGEGVDTLMNIEKLRFEGGGESRTVVVKFGSMPIVDLVADAATGSVLYGPGGGFTLRGGRGADIFQFLTAGDSPDTNRSRIIEFDPGRGDIIALADIPAFENIGAVEMIDGDGLVFTRLSAGSNFELDVYGVGAVPPLSSAGRGILDHVHIIGRDDHLIGGEGDDEISGLEGDDRIEGGGGSDRLEGGAGDDTLFGEGPAHGTDGVTDEDVDTAVFSQKRENYRIDIEGSGDSMVVHVTGIGAGAADGVDTLRGIEQLEFAGDGEGQRIVYKLTSLGTAGDDTLTGDGDDEGIEGGAGNDILHGGAGDDALFGGADSDTAVYAGVRGEYEVTVEAVWINHGLGSSTRVTLVRVEDIADDGMTDGSDEGLDTLEGVEFLRFADTGEGLEVDVSRLTPDTFTGTEADDTMVGGGGGQTVMGGGGYDIIFGGADDDTLDGGTDDDKAVYGGGVGDYLFTRDSGDLVVTDGADGGEDGIDEGRDTLRNIEHIRFGGLEGDVTVSVANIHIVTDNSVAVASHATENNIFHGEGGGFSFTGGSGADVFQFLVAGDSPTSGMTSITGFDPTQGDRIVLADITALENLTTREDSGDTILENTTSNFGVRLVGYTGGLTEGLEYVYVDAGDQPTTTAGASEGNDTLTGTGGVDVIDGGAGMDTINGEGGTDTLLGGAGDDVLVGGAGVDILVGGVGDDFLYGQAVDGTGPANESDIAVFAGHRDDYRISVGGFDDGGNHRVWVSVRDIADAGDPHGRDEGHDVLVDIDVLRFQGGNTDVSDDVSVMVSGMLAPVAGPLSPGDLTRTVAKGSPFNPIDVSDFFTDPTGGDLRFTVGAGTNTFGLYVNPLDGVLTGNVSHMSEAAFIITASNAYGDFEQNIRIGGKNPDPDAEERAKQVINSAVVASGKPVEINIRNAFYDPDNDTLTYELNVGRPGIFDEPGDSGSWRPLSSVGLKFDPETGLITGTPTESVVEIVVRANDGDGDAIDPVATTSNGNEAVLPTFTIYTDPIEVGDFAPENMTVETDTALASDINVSLAFQNRAGLSPTYTVYGLRGTGLTFDSSTNMISGTFTSTEREKITLVAEARGDVEEHSFFIEANVAPRLSGKVPVFSPSQGEPLAGTPAETLTSGESYFIATFSAFTDDNLDSGDRLTYTLRDNPSGVSIGHFTGRIFVEGSATQNADQLQFVIIATDRAGGSAEYSLTLEVVSFEGTSAGDTLTGGAGNDEIRGLAGDDTITGEGGNDRIDGGDDSDTAVYAGNQGDYTFTREIIFEVETVNGMPESNGGVEWLVVEDTRANSPDGRDLLRNVEELDFSDNMDVEVSGITAPLVKITGDRLGNKLFGDAGDQEFRGGGGGDEIYGRGGEDTVVFDGDRSDYGIERRDDIQADGTFRSVLIVTNLDMSSGEGAVLRSIELLDFADERGVRSSEFSTISVIHGDGNDNTLEGGAGDQSISGGGGDDSLKGGAGDDFLNGGNDRLEGRTAATELTRTVVVSGERTTEVVYLAGDTAVYDDNMSEYRITKNLIWGVDVPGIPGSPSPLPGILPALPGIPAVTSPRTEAHSVEDIADDGATGGTDEGTDTLKDIEYLQFADATLQRSGNSVIDQRVNLAELPFTHLTGTEEDDSIGDTDQRKGVGLGDQIIDGGDGTDTVVYEGEITDFAFTRDTDMRLTPTDADTGDGTDEGTDALVNIETIRFGGAGGTVTVETANIHIVTDNSTPVTAQGSGRNIFYGEGGGFTFTGGAGADTFQFLTAADSTMTSTTTIMGFDQAEGDRVLLAGIGDLRGLAVAKPTVGGQTVTQLSNASSGFVLNIAGNHGITAVNMGDYVRYIGGPGDGDDVVTGLSGEDDVIEGLGGNDRIDGGGGQDTAVYAGARADYTVTSELVVTGSGNDTVTETVHFIEDNNRANGDEGRDELRSIEILRFAGGDVPIPSLSPVPVVVKITGDADDNTLTGMAGDQVIEGGPGDDTIDGGGGTGDVAVYAGDFDEYEIKEELVEENGQTVTRLTVRDTVNIRGDLMHNVVRDGVVVGGGNEGLDTLSGIERLRFKDGERDLAELGKTVIGTGGNDATLMGGSGNDIIDGGAGDDTINGGAGNDGIGGGAGDDMIDGGAGHDTAVFRGGLSGYGISASLANGVVTLTVEDTASSPVDEDMVSLVNVEQLSFFEWKRTTSRLDDTDSSATDSLRHIIGSPRYDETALVVVTDHTVRKNNKAAAEIIVGDDTSNGTANGKVDGGAGNDWIFGLAMDDHIQGGLGDDMIFGGAGTDTAYFMAAREDYIIWQTGTGAARVTHVQDRDTMTHGGHEGRDQLVGVENIRFASHAAEAISSLTFDSAPAAAASVVDNFVDNPPDSMQYVSGGTVHASAWFTVPSGSTAEYGISSSAAFTINSATGVITAPGTLTGSTPVTVTVSTVAGDSNTFDDVSHTVLFVSPPDFVRYVAGGTVDASTWFGVVPVFGQNPVYTISSSAPFTIDAATGVITAPGALARSTLVTVTASRYSSTTDEDVSHTFWFTVPDDVPQPSPSIAEFGNEEGETSTSGDRAAAPDEDGHDPFSDDPDNFESVTPMTGDGDYFGL